jgi:hypothetical protein
MWTSTSNQKEVVVPKAIIEVLALKEIEVASSLSQKVNEGKSWQDFLEIMFLAQYIIKKKKCS